MFCHYFAEDNATFVVRYGKELFQILHLAAGNTPEPRASHSGPNQAVMAAEFSERTRE
jgi:hypothetical protein